ncbi:hypothetical protein [Paenibacillus glycanilyticus]|uniref:hypothetical protein n=1 Tax=Paenibacillus glycanilyticus TaxID=126569 RepID=UPI000FDAD472|nr:hypothetical protein [Paenibacillus glycanilyticus]
MGGAADVEALEKNENIDVIVDLRGEADGRAYPESKAQYVPISLGDNSSENQHIAFKQAIDEVVKAYRNGLNY